MEISSRFLEPFSSSDLLHPQDIVVLFAFAKQNVAVID